MAKKKSKFKLASKWYHVKCLACKIQLVLVKEEADRCGLCHSDNIARVAWK